LDPLVEKRSSKSVLGVP